MVDASKIVRTSTFESSIEVMDDSAWSKISSNDRKTEDVKPKNDPSPADETDLKGLFIQVLIFQIIFFFHR